MAVGKVKWFNNAKGYGFILPEGGGEDLFAHYSSIEMDGYKTLKAGQDVEYERLEGPKGFHAVNIRALGFGLGGSDQEAERVDGAAADETQDRNTPAAVTAPSELEAAEQTSD